MEPKKFPRKESVTYSNKVGSNRSKEIIHTSTQAAVGGVRELGLFKGVLQIVSPDKISLLELVLCDRATTHSR